RLAACDGRHADFCAHSVCIHSWQTGRRSPAARRAASTTSCRLTRTDTGKPFNHLTLTSKIRHTGTIMDQPLRTNELGVGHGTSPSGARTVRKIARVAAVVGVVAIGVLVWELVSAHRASAQLKEATEAQALVTVATTKPQP